MLKSLFKFALTEMWISGITGLSWPDYFKTSKDIEDKKPIYKIKINVLNENDR